MLLSRTMWCLLFIIIQSNAFAQVSANATATSPLVAQLEKFSGDVPFSNTYEFLESYWRELESSHPDQNLEKVARNEIADAYENKIIGLSTAKELYYLMSNTELTQTGIQIVSKKKEKRWRKRNLKNLSDTIRLKNWLWEQRKDKNTLEQDQKAIAVLSQSYKRRLPKLGSVSPDEYVIQKFNRIQINTLSDLISRTMQNFLSESAEITFHHTDGTETKVPLSASDIGRLASRLFAIELEQLKRSRVFKTTVPKVGDVVTSAYLTGVFDSEMVIELCNHPFLKETDTPLWKSTALFAWMIVRPLLYFNPYTAPAITLGTVMYQAIQRKKEHEKNESEKTHLIR